MNIVKEKVCEHIDRFFIQYLGKKGKIELCWDGQQFTAVKDVMENIDQITPQQQHETNKVYQR